MIGLSVLFPVNTNFSLGELDLIRRFNISVVDKQVSSIKRDFLSQDGPLCSVASLRHVADQQADDQRKRGPQNDIQNKFLHRIYIGFQLGPLRSVRNGFIHISRSHFEFLYDLTCLFDERMFALTGIDRGQIVDCICDGVLFALVVALGWHVPPAIGTARRANSGVKNPEGMLRRPPTEL